MSVKWIKITTTMFDDEKIDFIESLPEADSILIIWIKLLTLAGKSNVSGYIFLTENIPYTDEMLAHKFRRPLSTVRLALETLKRLDMIYLDDVGFRITNWEKHQNVDGLDKIRKQTRERVAKHRELKQIAQPKEGVTLHVTHGNATDIEEELDIDKEIKDIVENKFSPDSSEYILTQFLISKMLENNPNAKVPQADKPLERWIDAMEKIHRLDKYTHDQIRAVIKWSQSDNFWKSNILSAPKLREKMPTLILQMQRKGGQHAQFRTSTYGNDFDHDSLSL